MPQPHESRPTHSLERDFAALIASYERHRRVAAQRSPLGPAELRLMWLLSDGVPRTLRDISETLNLEQSTVNRQANAALDHGIVARSRASGSRYTFTPTELGSERLELSITSMLEKYRDAFNQMGSADAQQFVSLLGAFVAAYTGEPNAGAGAGTGAAAE